MSGEAPRVPLWRASGYRLAPPGPATAEERGRASWAAQARIYAYEQRRAAIRLLARERRGER